jgi:hypothetical protein
MFSQGDEPGVPKWNARPVFYYMYYFQKYFGDELIQSEVDEDVGVLAFASRFSSGEIGVVLVNTGHNEQIVRVDVKNFGYGDRFFYHTLVGGTDNGEFSRKVVINGETTSLASGGPSDPDAVLPRASDIAGGIKVVAPARSVLYILLSHGNNAITSAADEENVAIKVYPNPARGSLKVTSPFPGFEALEIMSLQGRCVYRHLMDKTAETVDVKPELPPGMYWLVLHKGGQILHRKIIIH